jgi:SagB-type dehydrogenase family enzyme
MYPCELYLVSNSADGLPSGVYHYDTAHHSLAQLSREDRTRRLSESVGVDSSAFLVATIRFWKNAFKYNSFCYHVVGQDLGCLLATWRLVAAASRRTYRPVTVFDDRRVAHIIDVDPMTDGPFLVLPLSRSAPTGRRDASGGLLGQHAVRERSKRVRTFPLIEHVQAACIADPPMLPDDQCDVTSFPSNPAGERKVLPQPDLEAAVVASVIRRRSSFGLLTAATELPLRSLAATLELADKIVRSPIDDLDHGSAVRLRVLAGKVEGLERRSYLYEPGSGALVAGPEIDFHALQQLYPLSNYSIDQTSAIVTVSVNLNAYLDRYGPRGYRRASIDVGQACQGVCTAAAAERIGAGAVLGVDTTAVDGLAGVALPEQTLLCIMIGTERPVSADYMQSIRTPGTVTA